MTFELSRTVVSLVVCECLLRKRITRARVSANLCATAWRADDMHMSTSAETAALALPRRASHSPTLLRKGIPGERKPLKEKLITYYEQLFKGEDPSEGNARFWDEFFLLKVNVPYFLKAVAEIEVPELIGLKKSLSLLFVQCCRTLQLDDNVIRNINALQTLCVLLRATFEKKLTDMSFDVIDVVIGFDSAECQMRNLIEALNKFLIQDYPASLKNLCLRLLLVVLTATDNISQNIMLEYIMMNSVFETIMHILSVPELQEQHGYDAVVVLTLLVNYRKYEAANPYVIKLSVLDDEIALHGLGSVVSSVLTEYNRKYTSPSEQPVGIFAHITSFVSNILVPMETPREVVRIDKAVLLVLYEAIHLNRNFITVLTHTKSFSNPATPTTPNPAIDRSLPIPSTPTSPTGARQPVSTHQPTNLLSTFLTFSSIVLQNIKDDESLTHARLCMVILTCIVEDQFANAFLHDPNMTFPVTLHRASLLHRKSVKEDTTHSRPLACSLLDLMVEFMISHMSKNFKLDLYRRCLGVVHRMLCYQKRCKIRLCYSWKELWVGLLNLLKFFATSEEHLLPKFNIFLVAIEVVKIFNLFITYGDTFLPNPGTYDELYYELIRMQKVFEDVHAMAKRYSSPDMHSEYHATAGQLASNLVNLRSIAAHFHPRINSWSASNQVTSITPEQVLEVVRSNYDTLTLKLQDNLDHFDKYAEKLNEASFFTQLLRSVTHTARETIALSSVEQLTLLTELGSAS